MWVGKYFWSNAKQFSNDWIWSNHSRLKQWMHSFFFTRLLCLDFSGWRNSVLLPEWCSDNPFCHYRSSFDEWVHHELFLVSPMLLHDVPFLANLFLWLANHLYTCPNDPHWTYRVPQRVVAFFLLQKCPLCKVFCWLDHLWSVYEEVHLPKLERQSISM